MRGTSADAEAARERRVPPRGIRRRLVLYVHGFDPRGPGVVHALQKADAGIENGRPGRGLVIGARRRQPSASAWSVTASWPEGDVENDFVALRWDDLVRGRWEKSLSGQARGLWRWVVSYVGTGAMWKLIGASRTMMIGAVALPLAVAAFLICAAIAMGLAAWGFGALAVRVGQSPWWGVASLLLMLVLPTLWRLLDGKVNLCWLGRGHLHMVELAQGSVKGMDDRIDLFSRRLLDEVDGGDWDEVLVVGHSSGSIHAADLLGRAVSQRPDLGDGRTGVGLITLGHCMPGYSMAGPVPSFRTSLAALVAAERVRWLDITAAADPGAGGAWSPLRHSPFDGDERVERRSPRFHKALSAEAFHALKRDPMAYHFQYMRSSDDPSAYDWYRLAFGPEAFSR